MDRPQATRSSRHLVFFLLAMSALTQTGYASQESSFQDTSASNARNLTNMSADVESAHQEANHFLDKLFQKYGHSGGMTFEGLEHLLSNLGLAQLVIDDHGVDVHFLDGQTFSDLHSNHEHNSTSSLERTHDHHTNHDGDDDDDLASHDGDNDDHGNHNDNDDHGSHDGDDDDHGNHNAEDDNHGSHDADDDGLKAVESHSTNITDKHTQRGFDDVMKNKRRQKRETDNTHVHHHKEQCMTVDELLSLFHIQQVTDIDRTLFLYLCPAIVQQLESSSCREEESVYGHGHGNNNSLSGGAASAAVWGYASIAVTIISLVGLASVAVIPIMNKVFYNHLLQFLVALAVGTLTGDALLHLIPHASFSEEDASDDHGNDYGEVWRGLIVLGGSFFFFMAERLMTVTSVWRAERKTRHKVRQRRDSGSVIGEKLHHHKGSLHPCEDLPIVGHPGADIRRLTEECIYKPSAETCLSDGLLRSDSKDDDDKADAEAGEMPPEHYDDSPSHGHSHDVPSSVSAVAWMVIMGDGLHNFTDGMAIGTAFMQSLAVGVSTTVAVFCHELPHELGDFAVLLQSGMSVKQALAYNIVSSVLSFIGMVAGILLGSIESAKSWIFALTAGIFIYIALVDMLPQLSAGSAKLKMKQQLHHLLLQMLGITMGIGIMTTIALYEDKIRINVGNY